VYLLSDELALIETVDFFTPIVDDPYTFGQIAAANALSDVYAMGGVPIVALNIVGFPSGMELAVLREILRGGLDKLKEAGCALGGGHSINDPELKYGMAVTGTVHPSRILKNHGALAGDVLLLTKPLGTGIINTAVKAGVVPDDVQRRVEASMATLNKRALEIALPFELHACTDITGFGLLGHGLEMVDGSGLGLIVESARLPVFPELREYSDMGLLPGGLHRNRAHRQCRLEISPGVPQHLVDAVCDPQTSGGLLVALPEPAADALRKELRDAGLEAAIAAQVVADPGERFVLR
jgi:selenide,water dikinase